MRSAYAIYRKELGHYFVSPIAYVVIGLFSFLLAVFFNDAIASVMSWALQSMQYGGGQIDMPAEVMRDFLGGITSLLTLFILPAITMGVYAEERKRGTMELLMTSPISETQIVLGKFFASLTLWLIMLVPGVAYMSFMYLHSDPVPPWRILLAGFLGAVLFGASLLALGSFFSSLTENQVVAFVLTFSVFLILWVIQWVGQNMFASTRATGALGSALSYLSVIRHYDDFTKGIIDTSSLVYYLSFIFLFVFLTVRSVDSMRWRRA